MDEYRPTVRDRVVQNALRHVLEPILERQFAEHSYGFRPNRGCKDALCRVGRFVKLGYKYTVDVDLQSYFDTIPHDRLIKELRKHGADNSVIGLVEKFLQAQVLDGMDQWTPVAGAPQGAIISPMHPTKTKIVHVDIAGFEFLGYRFIKHRRFPRQKSLAKFKETIRSKTKRTNGHSLQAIIVNVNRTLRGWYEYFKHSWRTTFPALDGWIRMRLRSIHRKRTGGRGRGHGLDHYRSPNVFFAGQGLFSLTMAHACESQSCYK